jgi:hypothetical protein
LIRLAMCLQYKVRTPRSVSASLIAYVRIAAKISTVEIPADVNRIARAICRGRKAASRNGAAPLRPGYARTLESLL